MDQWHFLQSPTGHAAHNMAVDEALLRTAARRGRPLLRVYSWERPAVSFGYFQRFPANLADGRELVRRPTGGGIVYHGADTTYTVVVPPGHRLFEMSTSEAYCALHKAVATALSLRVELCATALESPRGGYECFQKPVAGDVVADGKKLAGAAQRRAKTGMLHQGSIATILTADQLIAGFRKVLRAEFDRYELSAEESALSERLAREKYGTNDWNLRIR